MIVYCAAEDCKHWNDNKCTCVWPCGTEAISIEVNREGWCVCTDYNSGDGEDELICSG